MLLTRTFRTHSKMRRISPKLKLCTIRPTTSKKMTSQTVNRMISTPTTRKWMEKYPKVTSKLSNTRKA